MKKRIISFFLVLAMLLSMLPCTAFAASKTSFKDVASTAWYYNAVDYVSSHGIMSGVGNNAFSPETTLTRAQLCQILYNIEKKPYAGNGSFADVDASAWYSGAVNWAAKQGIVNGVGNGLFEPENSVSREQMVTILYRYAMYKNYSLSDLVSLADYSDASLIGSWAQDAMQWAVSEGIISGTTETTISPQGTATRAQAATMLMRFCQRMEAKQAFYAKNVDDFRGEEVINFDDSNETNFAVLAEDTVTARSSMTANQLVSSDEDAGVYTFSNIDQTISALKPGDVLYLTYGGGVDDYLLLKVGAIEVDGDTATITEGKAEISDYFQYIDVDMALDLSTEDFRPDNSASLHQDIVVPACLSAIQDIPQRDVSNSTLLQMPVILAKDASIKPSTNLKFELKKDNFSVAAEVKMTIKVKISYDKTLFDIEEISYSVEQETSLSAKVSKSVTSTKHDTYKKSSKTPPISLGTGIEAELETYFVFDVDASADGTISGKYTSESGTKYSKGVAQEINQSNTDISIDIGGSFNVATGFGVAGNLKLLKIITLSLSAEAGVEADAKGSLINASANTDEKHLCAFCVDGTLDTYFEVGFKPKVGISDKYSVTLLDAKPFKVKTEFGKFYISKLDSDSVWEFDWGKCPHKAYLVTAVATDQFGNRLTDATITIRNDNSVEAIAIGKTETDGTFKTYCENGNYRVSALSLDGYQNASEVIDVNSKATTVMLQMKNDNAAPKSEVVVDMFTGMPQIRYYNDKGQVAYCIMMNSGWDSGSSEDFPTGYLQNAFAIAFTYDSNGKLTHSASTEIHEADSAMGPLGCLFEGNLSYRYEGNLIKAYDSNGSLCFSMDEHGNIVNEQSRSPYVDWEGTTAYTYDKQGNVTGIKKSDSWGKDSETQITYNSSGNVTTYRETIHEKDENGKEVTTVRDRKYTYENGALSRFDDSDYSKWPWLLSYDSNHQISELQIEDLDDGSHSGHYVSGEEYFPDGWHSQYSLMTYRFSAKNENEVPSLSVWYYLDYRADDPAYDYDVEKTVTIPSK